MPMATLAYSKPALDTAGQLRHLQSRGLIVHDIAAAEASLKRLGYNRLLIYTRPLQDTRKHFLRGTSFDDVVYLYEFDRKLRFLCMDAIEDIEVALRSALGNALARVHGPHFYGDISHYNSVPEMVEFLSQLGRTQSPAIKHYKATYRIPAHPPIWALLEATTYGNLSCLFSSLSLANRKLVAAELGYDETLLTSWLLQRVQSSWERCSSGSIPAITGTAVCGLSSWPIRILTRRH
jgi:abortive infection bacteriophage resistance protein